MSAAASAVATTPPATLSLPEWLLRAFALDLRALAALRIGLGAILLWDVALRAGDLTAHYTDAGVLPRAGRMAMERPFCEPWWMSLHMLGGSAWWQGTLFTVAALAATMLLLGYRTKPALFVSWLLLVGVHGRFPLLTQGGDMLLRCMLFWSLFLPLDECWSWSGRGQKSEVGSQKSEGTTFAVSLGTAAFIVQLAILYVFTAMLKTSPSWRGEFSAVYYALSIDHFTSEVGYVLLGYPRLLQLLTLASLLLESVGPWLLLMPVRQTLVRIAVPLAFIGFHLGLAATMDLGNFPWICILFWIVLLPPVVWDYAERVIGRARLLPSRISYRSAGVLSSQTDVQRIGSFYTNAIAAFLLCYVILLNVNRLAHPLATVGRPPLSYVGKVTGLDQYWNMFSPGPYRFGGWLRIEGETADGRLVNLYRPIEPLPDVRPANVSSTYPTQYWRRCLVTMYEFQEQPHMEGGLRYFARQWNEIHPSSQRIVRARLVHMVEPVPDPFDGSRAQPKVERRELCVVDIH